MIIRLHNAVFAAACLLLSEPASAVPVASFTGSYNEATGPETLPSGDYDSLGGLSDVGDFHLVAGENSFAGSIRTPDDPSDVFNIVVGQYQTLRLAYIIFALNASINNPFFGAPPPQWTLQESSTTPVIFDVALGPDGTAVPVGFDAPAFSRGPGTYAMLIGNGTFAMNNGAAVRYEMFFFVEETLPPPPPPGPQVVPLPATLPLLAGGLLLLALRRKARA